MRISTHNPTEMTFVYVRRDSSVDIKRLIGFANSIYDIGCLDVIVVDMCKDQLSLENLAKNGDPFRYFRLDSGVSIDEILAAPRNYSRFSDILVIDQNDVL